MKKLFSKLKKTKTPCDEATEFAMELLMPKDIFKFLAKDVGLSDRELAKEFIVNIDHVRMRKKMLRIK